MDLTDQALQPGSCYPGRVLKAIAQQIENHPLPLKGRTYLACCLQRPDPDMPGGKSDLTGKYPSLAMGLSLHFHGRLGLAAFMQLDQDHYRDQDVVAFFDFPKPITVHYKKRDKRAAAYKLTPKIVVMRGDRTVLVDLQEEEQLQRLAMNEDSRYVFEEDRWRFPSAEAAAKELGFDFEVWTERRLGADLVNNAAALEDFLLERDLTDAQKMALEAVVSAVGELGAPRLDEVIAAVQPRAGVVDALRAIARGNLFVNLNDCDLGRWKTVQLFPDRTTLEAFSNATLAQEHASSRLVRTSPSLTEGDRVLWDGAVKEIINVGFKTISFRDGDNVTTLSNSQVDKLLEREMVLLGSTKVLKESRLDDAHDLLNQTPSELLEVANLRLARIRPFIAGLKKPAQQDRTIRRYIKKYRDAERICGNGYNGLVPGWGKCGNRVQRLSEKTMEIVAEYFAKYAVPNGPSRISVYKRMALDCDERGYPPPCYSWWCGFIKKQDPYKLKLARDGMKAAYQIQPAPDESKDREWRCKRAWQTGFVDHTEMDLETIFSESGENLCRTWLSLMIDGCSRRVLAFFISYHAPSSASVMMLVRDCVKRFNRLPNEISVDGGKEFRSLWFQSFCATYKVTILWRPAAKSRWGAVIERMFGTENTMLLRNFRGNTQATKNVRAMSKSVDPKKLAVWDLPSLYTVQEEFFFSEYDNHHHTGIRTTPRLAEEASVVQHGERPMRFIAYSQNFVIDTCPETRKGTARVTRAGVKVFGFCFNARNLYPFIGQDLRVRYDPYNLAIAWAWTDNQWLQLSSQFTCLLKGMSEYEMKLISLQYRQQMKDVVAAQRGDLRFAKFLKRVLETEEMLLERKKTLDLQRAHGWVWQEEPHPSIPATSPEPEAAQAELQHHDDDASFEDLDVDPGARLAALDIQVEDLDDFVIL